MGDEPLTVRCACGWQIRGSEAEVVAATQDHGRRVHNMLPSREEVLRMVVVDRRAADSGTSGRS